MDANDIQSASIVPADGTITINGETYTGCDIAQERHDKYGPVHAIQWWGDHGNVEHGNGPAIGFTNIDKVLNFVPAWLARRAEVLREMATHHETQMASAAHNLEGHTFALENIEATLEKEGGTLEQAAKDRLERVRDDLVKRIEHFTDLHAMLSGLHAAASEKASQAEKDAA